MNSSCNYCGHSIKSGSSFCPQCGNQIDSLIESHDQVKAGRQKMILIILAILTASLTGQAFTLWFELVFETISNDFFFSTIISIGLLGLLLYFLYHGYRWAKWIAAPGLILVSLILFGLVFTTFSSPIAPIFMLVLVTQSFLYLTSGIVLSRSDDVATFLKEQERKRDKFS